MWSILNFTSGLPFEGKSGEEKAAVEESSSATAVYRPYEILSALSECSVGGRDFSKEGRPVRELDDFSSLLNSLSIMALKRVFLSFFAISA